MVVVVVGVMMRLKGSHHHCQHHHQHHQAALAPAPAAAPRPTAAAAVCASSAQAASAFLCLQRPARRLPPDLPLGRAPVSGELPGWAAPLGVTGQPLLPPGRRRPLVPAGPGTLPAASGWHCQTGSWGFSGAGRGGGTGGGRWVGWVGGSEVVMTSMTHVCHCSQGGRWCYMTHPL